MINDRVYFGKGEIRVVVAISRKYWDEGNISINVEKILFIGRKGVTEIPLSEIRSAKMVSHRIFKVIRATKHNDEFYHITSVPQTSYGNIADTNLAAKRQNEVLYNAIDHFLYL